LRELQDLAPDLVVAREDVGFDVLEVAAEVGGGGGVGGVEEAGVQLRHFLGVALEVFEEVPDVLDLLEEGPLV
jgi:hypothetical protein